MKLNKKHVSIPELKARKSEQVSFEKIKTENLELRNAIKRRTIELEHKNRELEIEASLEKVRTKAMGMRKPDDMLDICKIISVRLQLLGVKEIRNVQTAIFYRHRGTYMNYEYYAKHNKTFITETLYTNHKIHKQFAQKMLNGKGEFFTTHIKGKKVKDWIEYQKTTNVFIDKYLETASSLNYYWFSLGPVALGISTYNPLKEGEINLFKRFLKVFELAYQRYLDIEKAEAQTREARIETALEKVRAVAMGMNKPGDLLNISETLYYELKSLGFDEIRNSMINIHNDDNKTFLNYDFSEEIGKTVTLLDYNAHPVMEKQIMQSRMANDAFSEAIYKGKDLEKWKEFRRKYGEKDDPRIDKIKALYYYFYSIGTGTIGISTFKPIGEEKLVLLKRFRNVFSLAYQRYSDLALAESQAREAHIEMALERVRSRTMAMHKSDELLDIIAVVSNQLEMLGFVFDHVSFGENNQTHDYKFWISVKNQPKPYYVYVPYINNPMFENVKKAQQKGLSFYSDILTPEENRQWHEHVFANNDLDFINKKLQKFIFRKGYARSIALLPRIMLIIGNYASRPYSEEENNILMRFATVFQQSYTRFLDLKKAESQAREAQIEASLERVRSSAMAMHNSNDISSTTTVIFEELKKLNINSKRCGVVLLSNESGIGDGYAAAVSSDGKFHTLRCTIDMTQHESMKHQYESWVHQNIYETVLEGEELKSYYELPFFHSSAEYIPTNHFQSEYGYYIPFSKGLFYAWFDYTYGVNEKNILNRFKTIIELTFRRFFDLQNAEKQAREAQIEAALERVRSKTMAMHKSEQLAETATVLFDQFDLLGKIPDRVSIGIINVKNNKAELWLTDQTGKRLHNEYCFPLDEPTSISKIYKAWKEKEESIVIDLTGRNLKDWLKFVKEDVKLPIDLSNIKGRRVHQAAFFSHGFLLFTTHEPIAKEIMQLLIRFARVFDLTYTRFLDLQKAEAQARESQVQLALERVRARTMAMQKSEELPETASVLFHQFKELGENPIQITIGIINEAEGVIDFSVTDWSGTGKQVDGKFKGSIEEPTLLNKGYKAWKNQKKSLVVELSGKEMDDWISYRNALSGIKNQPRHLSGSRFVTFAYFTKGHISISTFEPPPAETIELLERFAGVFDLTYTRFLDLQNAEAQARDAQIEAALERVRSRALAMHEPDDVSSTISVFFKELKSLNVLPWRCGVGQIEEETRTTSLITTSISENGDSYQIMGKLKQEGHPVLDGIFEHWKLQKEYFPVLQGEDIKKYYSIIRPQIAYPEYPLDAVQYGHFIYFKEGFVFAWTENKLSEEELQIFRRFTSVLSLTYRRYIDLKEAGIRAFEAVRQASLDRVRAEITSMQTAEDLNRITPVVWRELKSLEVPFIRCGVFIIHNETKIVQVYLSTPDGKPLGVLELPYGATKTIDEIVKHWKKYQVYHEHWNKDEFVNWMNTMMEMGQVQNMQTYQGSLLPPESLDLHFVPFAQGMLYVGDVASLADEKLLLVKSLAGAFSIAYARYEDFRNLEDAKNKVELTLNELKSAQAQLVHSEKMASLGELTAGIAHEIKNPLNFVNNFSEISRELLDDMKKELQNKNEEEVASIIDVLKQNLEKINQHGKRADSIVKGMLLHSRGTTGEKILTDINDLLDQYIALAYHGMRAQNKEFNITIEKDFDDSIGKIKVVPQDISRVFLNIINNACYAANEQKKISGNNFNPLLKVSTKNLKDKVEITVWDNGIGIPDSVKGHIFNPFFTTKPTGEGTGLGLSLSYDIVTKVHGGEMKFNSEENKFTEFKIIIPKP